MLLEIAKSDARDCRLSIHLKQVQHLCVANTMLGRIIRACPSSRGLQGGMHHTTVTVNAWVIGTSLCAYKVKGPRLRQAPSLMTGKASVAARNTECAVKIKEKFTLFSDHNGSLEPLKCYVGYKKATLLLTITTPETWC